MANGIGWYDRQGRPVEREALYSLMRDAAYKRVAETTLPDGKWVSTVWIGLDHSWDPDGRPIIFETMVFPNREKFSDLDCDRYSTEEEARAGHDRMVAKWLAGGGEYGD